MNPMHIADCVKWLWRMSRGFRIPITVCTLTGTLHVCTSLLFIYVCKHLIDIATDVADDSLGTYIALMAS